jgi:hypothetical protein
LALPNYFVKKLWHLMNEDNLTVDLVLLQQCRLVAFVMLLIVGGHSAVSPGMQMTLSSPPPPARASKNQSQCAGAKQQIWLGEHFLSLSPPERGDKFIK